MYNKYLLICSMLNFRDIQETILIFVTYFKFSINLCSILAKEKITKITD